LSVGIEDVADLLSDLADALQCVAAMEGGRAGT
jgi:cystathionine beta-lyase/cystathionine gamma-synthase